MNILLRKYNPIVESGASANRYIILSQFKTGA